MSQVALSGNVSGTGTFTIAAPNSNTDRTLSLPDQTGTLLTGSGALNINASAPASSLTLDASGQLGVGTSSPGFRLDVSGTIRGRGDQYFGWINGSQAGVWWSQTNYAVPAFQGLTSAGNAGDIVMQPGGGNLLVGTTSAVFSNAKEQVVTTGSGNFATGLRAQDRGIVIRLTAAEGYLHFFERNNGSYVGDIYATNSGTTLYSSASDYRLKEKVQPMTGALAKVALLKPCTYKWNADGSDGEGFIAHELQEVIPQAVRGAKDAVDAEGKPVYQGIDTSFLVATLTAAIQELKADLDATKAELAALKGQA